MDENMAASNIPSPREINDWSPNFSVSSMPRSGTVSVILTQPYINLTITRGTSRDHSSGTHAMHAHHQRDPSLFRLRLIITEVAAAAGESESVACDAARERKKKSEAECKRRRFSREYSARRPCRDAGADHARR